MIAIEKPVVQSQSANGTPLVSAIIATYNRAHIVGEAIESILQQTYKNLELIVVDDGSTDSTEDKLKEYGDRIRVVYQKNSGPAAAWNAGIKAARGEIVAFLGSDDIWLPTFVERHVEVLQRCDESVPCCLSNAILSFGSGKKTTSFGNAPLYPPYDNGIWVNVAEVISTRFVLFGQAVAIRRNAFQSVGYFDEGLRYLEDYDMALRLSLRGPWAFIREPLVVWRQGSGNGDNLSLEAGRNPIQVRQILIRIHQRAMRELSSGDQATKLERWMRRKLRRDRANLMVAKLTQSSSRGRRTIGKLLARLDNYRYSALRRAPWFPKMKTRCISSQRPSAGLQATPSLRSNEIRPTQS